LVDELIRVKLVLLTCRLWRVREARPGASWTTGCPRRRTTCPPAANLRELSTQNGRPVACSTASPSPTTTIFALSNQLGDTAVAELWRRYENVGSLRIMVSHTALCWCISSESSKLCVSTGAGW